jgi:predicted nucleic acid-binding protein
LLREKKISKSQYEALKTRFLDEITNAEICPINDVVLTTSVHVVEAGTVRTLDALHVAGAKFSECDQFVTADKRQHEAAIRAGLHSVLIE